MIANNQSCFNVISETKAEKGMIKTPRQQWYSTSRTANGAVPLLHLVIFIIKFKIFVDFQNTENEKCRILLWRIL